jgi:demethylmenaquinone methyltransferase / 2-methoxy-6-polyprenyl-1,4-benzoquinol methylase
VAILGWSYQQLLPGYPLLEARLNTASSLAGQFDPDAGPDSHFLRAPGWFHKAGFVKTRNTPYAGDIRAPLSDEKREAVQAFFEMLWENASPAVSKADWSLFERIRRPGSSEYILDRDDYYGYFIYVCFSGEVPER